MCTHVYTRAHTCVRAQHRTHTYVRMYVLCTHVHKHACAPAAHMCTHMYVHVCTCTRVHMQTSMHVHSHTPVCACTHECKHVCTQTHVCIHIHTCIHMHMCTQTHAHMHVDTYTPAHMHIWMQAHTYPPNSFQLNHLRKSCGQCAGLHPSVAVPLCLARDGPHPAAPLSYTPPAQDPGKQT